MRNLDIFLVSGLGSPGGIDLCWKRNDFLHSFAKTAIFSILKSHTWLDPLFKTTDTNQKAFNV